MANNNDAVPQANNNEAAPAPAPRQVCPVCGVGDCVCSDDQDERDEGDDGEDDDYLCFRCAVPWEDCDCGDYNDQDGRHCGICRQLMDCACTEPRQCDVCQQPKRYCSCNNADDSDSD